MDPIEKLFTFSGRGIKTFDAMKRLDARLNFPHRKFRSIHVGGTNGKGSVSWKIGAALRAEGYKVGVYTSPHIHSFRERIVVDGMMIEEDVAQRLIQQVLDVADEELSFFDLLTAVAFLYFVEKAVDWAVVEVGLGGRLDATNVIDPEVAVITNIGWDHTDLLGDTLEKIAQEKRGIAKPGVPLIVGAQASQFFPEAQAVCFKESFFYDEENSRTAQTVLKHLKVSQKAIDFGVVSRPPCRFEIIGNTILDVAHNVSGFQELVTALQAHFPNEKFHFMVAFSKGKDWNRCLSLIEPHAAHITFVGLGNPRFYPSGEMRIVDALGTIAAREVICGSFYIMDEARSALASGSVCVSSI